jgi:catechol 2,3-dioxygenase-like lactoylglutathione lyase family enzyme
VDPGLLNEGAERPIRLSASPHRQMIRISVVLDCTDAAKLAAFWTGALGYEQVAADGEFIGLKDPDGRLPTLVLQRVPERKVIKNRMHIDVFSDDFDRHFVRLTDLGATIVTPEHLESDGMRLVVLADPEGNEFCLLDPTAV